MAAKPKPAPKRTRARRMVDAALGHEGWKKQAAAIATALTALAGTGAGGTLLVNDQVWIRETVVELAAESLGVRLLRATDLCRVMSETKNRNAEQEAQRTFWCSEQRRLNDELIRTEQKRGG